MDVHCHFHLKHTILVQFFALNLYTRERERESVGSGRKKIKETLPGNFHIVRKQNRLISTQTLAETSLATASSFFFGVSLDFSKITLFGTNTMKMFLSLKLLASSVASCTNIQSRFIHFIRCNKIKSYSQCRV